MAHVITANEHELTLFHRGKTDGDFMPEVALIIGDRELDLELITESYDVVIDTSGYYPRVFQLFANHFKCSVGIYNFISSISAFEGTTNIGITAEAPRNFHRRHGVQGKCLRGSEGTI